MPENSNDVEAPLPLIRTSLQMPPWMLDRLDAIAERTLSTRSQVLRRAVAEWLECEARQPERVAV